MKRFTLCSFILILIFSTTTLAAFELEYLGLADYNITSLSVYDGIVAVGTHGSGVFWQGLSELPSEDWHLVGLISREVTAVYAHKSGPIGWAIGSAVVPAGVDPEFIYCAYMGQNPQPNSQGIDPNLTVTITALDGFPDPTICGETFAAGGQAIYRREYGSDIWTIVYHATFEGHIHTVKTREEYPGVVVAGGGDGFAGILLIKSLDYGQTWENISPMGYIHDLDFIGAEADTIFAVSSGSVWRTFDSGDSWEAVIEIMIPEIHFGKVLIDPDQERVYLAGYSTLNTSPLQYSDDWGETWQEIPNTLTGISPVVTLAQSYDGVLLAHQSDGIFRLIDDASSIDDAPEISTRVMLHDSYPNPFRNETTIELSLPQPTHAVLKIFNALGQEIKTLLDKPVLNGSQSVTWNGTDNLNQRVAPGIYFYQLQTDEMKQTKRTVLLR